MAEGESQNIYAELLSELALGRDAGLKTLFKGKRGSLAQMHKELVIEAALSEEEKQAFLTGVPRALEAGDETSLMEPFSPEERLIVLGGGHIALPLVQFASTLGFNVTVVDDRLSFANKGRFPDASEVLCLPFGQALESLKVSQKDYVVIITRGHRHDALCLRSLLTGTEPGYLGMIGSRRRTAIVKETLSDEGFDRERLNRVHTPVGLSIGAITPEEIALSIMAEVVSVKRLGKGDKKAGNRADTDRRVLQILAAQDREPKALITIIKAAGSVPRGAGAKMLAYADGRILGSIGGGCSESDVLNAARTLIGSGSYEVMSIDLTGEAALDEGMVCGGTLTVLLEDICP